MNEGEKSLIWDLLIPDKELKELSYKLTKKKSSIITPEDLWQEMRMNCWGKLTNKGFWITLGKNHALDVLRHENVEQKYTHLNSMDFGSGGLFDEEIHKLTTKRIYEKE